MKNLNVYNLLMALCFVLCFTSCSKEGDMGPEGPKGDKGDKGEAGSQGIPGTDGNLLLYGTEAPADTDGNTGDYYIDSQNYTLYGPKTDSGWGTPINLNGADGQDGSDGQDGNDGIDGQDGNDGVDGQDGQDGNTLLSGMEVPDASIGVNGDFYFHITTVSIYGPKTDSGWGNGVSLKGDQGDQGVPGTANVITTEWYTGNRVIRSWSDTGRWGTANIELNTTQVQSLTSATGAESLYDFLMTKGGTILVYFKGVHANTNSVSIGTVPGKYYAGDFKIYDITRWKVSDSRKNRITINIEQLEGGDSMVPVLDIRLVLIPSGQPLASAKGTILTNDIDWKEKSYEEIKELLHLED